MDIIGVAAESIKRILPRKAKNRISAFLNVILGISCRGTAFLTKALSKNMTVTYNSEFKNDGTGAQLQRQFGVFVLSRAVGCNFSYTPIKDVAIHPLDPFQSPGAYADYMSRLNSVFALASEIPTVPIFDLEVEIDSPSITSFVGLAFKSFFTGTKVLIRVGEPYKISEHFQSEYSEVLGRLQNWPRHVSDEELKTIAIHFRQGVGGKVIYPGQSIPRELDLEYFRDAILGILSEENGSRIKLVVLTDAPNQSTSYETVVSQRDLWEGTPGFANGVLTISPFSFEPLKDLGLELEVKSGGDPIEAIQVMSESDFLVMGRSSLSFVAGVLNKRGTVYAAPEFWHKPLPGWRQVIRKNT